MRYKNEVILAGFLHDIGKFYQKSGSKTGSIDGIELSGGHQQISVNFFNRYIDMFKPFIDVDITREMIQRHHEGHYVEGKPDYDVQYAPEEYIRYCKIVAIADNISSSERAEKTEKSGSLGFEHATLHSVFTRADSSKVGMYKFGVWNAQNLIPEQIDLDEAYKSMDKGEQEKYRKELYKHNRAHISEFSDTINKLSNKKFNNFEHLLAELQIVFRNYLWCCISESQGKIRDISLYDHLLTTSAIAISLYSELYKKKEDNFSDRDVQRIMDNITKKNETILNTVHIRINGIDRLFDTAGNNTEYYKKNITFIDYINSLKSFTNELLNDAINKSVSTSSINNCIIKYGYDWYIIASDSELGRIESELKKVNKQIFDKSGSNLYLSYGIRKLYDKVVIEDICSKNDVNLLIDLMTSNGQWDIDKFSDIHTDLSLTFANKASSSIDKSSYNSIKFVRIKCASITQVLKKKFKSEDGNENYNSISRISTYMRLVDGFFDTYITERCKNSINISFGLGTSYMICTPDVALNNLIVIYNGFKRISLGTLIVKAIIVKVANRNKIPRIYDSINKAEYELIKNKARVSYCEHILDWVELYKLNSICNYIKKAKSNNEVSAGFIKDLAEYSNMYNEYLKTGDPKHLLLYALFTNKINKESRGISKEFKAECSKWVLDGDLSEVNTNLKLLNLSIKEMTEQERKITNE